MGSSSKNPGLWVIRHKITKQHVRAPSGKTSWAQPGHAKNAWLNHPVSACEKLGVDPVPTGYNNIVYGNPEYNGMRFPKFSEQDVYEVVDMSQENKDLTGRIVEFLMQIQGRLEDWDLENKATELLKELNSDGSNGRT